LPARSVVNLAFLEDPAAAADLPQWVLSFAREQHLFEPGDRVLVAVSGGPDSVALLQLLNRLQSELEVTLAVGHFDHGLRGQESAADAAFVGGLAQQLNLPFHLGRGKVRDLARMQKISLQMAGRRARLDFLRETCRAHTYHRLALGHTADDQIELFWLRLLRGSSREGLKGMWPATPEGLVRPLLSVGKDVVLAWLRQQCLLFRSDSSNLSRAYLRNRVRLDLLPELSRDNPRFRQAVFRTQTLLMEEEEFLAAATASALDRVVQKLGADCYALDLAGLMALAPALQKRVLRVLAGKISGDHGLTAARVASLLDLARTPRSGGILTLGRSLQVARAGGELHFFRPWPAPMLGGAEVLAEADGQADSPGGWRWRWHSRTLGPGKAGLPRRPQIARLDRDRVSFPLEARAFRPGDRFRPQGAPGVRKLQDFLVDRKIPRWLRPHLPLLAYGGEILWAPGLGVGETVGLSPDTRNVLEIELTPATANSKRVWEILLRCRERFRDRNWSLG
jgi:tRNA(Ile)-lysidine synthase